MVSGQRSILQVEGKIDRSKFRLSESAERVKCSHPGQAPGRADDIACLSLATRYRGHSLFSYERESDKIIIGCTHRRATSNRM